MNESELKKFIFDGLQKAPVAVTRFCSGGNNQVFKVVCEDKEKLLAKIYFKHGSGIENPRLRKEFSALCFLWGSGFREVPEPLYADETKQTAIYKYVDGEKPDPSVISDEDLIQAADFLARLSSSGDYPGALFLGRASDSCFCLNDYWKSIDIRCHKLRVALENRGEFRDVIHFLDGPFSTVRRVIRAQFETLAVTRGVGMEERLTVVKPVLSPSDFGFHNAVRKKNGTICFLDFEYFGWDDPAKLIADFFHQPETTLTEKQKNFFLNSFLKISGTGEALVNRLKLVYYVTGLKWCLLILNICLPEVMERKRFARPEISERDFVKSQLEKAGNKLEKLIREIGKDSIFLHN